MAFTFSKELTDYYQADTAATAIHGFISGLYEQPMISITLKNSTPRSKKYMLSVEYEAKQSLDNAFERICNGVKDFNKARALSAELDKRQTINNAKSVLNVYRRMERIAGSPYVPNANRTSNNALNIDISALENTRQNRKFIAELERDCMREAIEKIQPQELKTILVEKYCIPVKKSNIELYYDLGRSESAFYRDLDDALLEFAAIYKNGKLLAFL